MIARWPQDSKVTGDLLPLLFYLFGPCVARLLSSQITFFAGFDNARLDMYKRPYNYLEQFNPSSTWARWLDLSHPQSSVHTLSRLPR